MGKSYEIKKLEFDACGYVEANQYPKIDQFGEPPVLTPYENHERKLVVPLILKDLMGITEGMSEKEAERTYRERSDLICASTKLAIKTLSSIGLTAGDVEGSTSLDRDFRPDSTGAELGKIAIGEERYFINPNTDALNKVAMIMYRHGTDTLKLFLGVPLTYDDEKMFDLVVERVTGHREEDIRKFCEEFNPIKYRVGDIIARATAADK